LLKRKNLKLIFNIIAAVLFIFFLWYLTFRYSYLITELFLEPEKFRNLALSYGGVSILIFILFQFLQVVIVPIPGEVVQIAGGFVYGTFPGTLYSLLGITIGYIFIFNISRILGYPLVKIFVPQTKIDRLRRFFETPRADTVIFLLFLIPGLPKDFLVYTAGLTPIKPLRFLSIVVVARLPALFGSSFIGANIQEKDYLVVFIVLGLSIVFFLVFYFQRERIIKALENKFLGKLQSLKKRLPEK
jgi:uncharacterized membrane protein YdjX (TVP38/TMEM64 family)